MVSIQITSISPALCRMARAYCIIIGVPANFLQVLLLASLVWSRLEPRYRNSCSRLKIYGSFYLMFESASIARDFDGTEKLVCEHNEFRSAALTLQRSAYRILTRCVPDQGANLTTDSFKYMTWRRKESSW